MTSSTETNRLNKIKQIQLLERKNELKEGLPHLYGFKLYSWQREFIESTNKVNLLCAGNQIGKSSCNLLKMIHWATEPTLWPKLWPHRRPQQFWTLLPTKDIQTTEFRTKIEPEFLPRGEFKKHGQYAWEPEFRNRYLWAIHFINTGISIYTHTYEQDVHHLQAGTVDALFVDEEPPWELMPELLMRTSGTNGYFSAVMTPTKGQEQWRRAFEVKGHGEVFSGAFKKKVSVFDCMKYEDGSKSSWTDERVAQMMNKLGTQQEIDLRIYGKFVVQDGLRVPAFDREKNIIKPVKIPDEWYHFAGVDIGSGGLAHPPAIVFVAVNPTYTKAYIYKVWVGEKTRNYTVTDILEQYAELRGDQVMTGQYYDFASAEFGLVASRAGLGFEKAEKGHDVGYPLLNSLFKNDMLNVFDNDGSLTLITELLNLRHDSKKLNDDTVDALRYAISKLSWNFEMIKGEYSPPSKNKSKQSDERLLRPPREEEAEANLYDPAQEIEAWNDIFNELNSGEDFDEY
jgi:phage terminase large subunit-like protein